MFIYGYGYIDICNMYVYLRIYVHDNMYVIYVYMYRSQLPDLPLGHYAASVITERAHRQYIYLFIYLYSLVHKNIINIWNRKLIWISQIVMIDLLIE